jgi:hypothetical protein
MHTLAHGAMYTSKNEKMKIGLHQFNMYESYEYLKNVLL